MLQQRVHSGVVAQPLRRFLIAEDADQFRDDAMQCARERIEPVEHGAERAGVQRRLHARERVHRGTGRAMRAARMPRHLHARLCDHAGEPQHDENQPHDHQAAQRADQRTEKSVAQAHQPDVLLRGLFKNDRREHQDAAVDHQRQHRRGDERELPLRQSQRAQHRHEQAIPKIRRRARDSERHEAHHLPHHARAPAAPRMDEHHERRTGEENLRAEFGSGRAHAGRR